MKRLIAIYSSLKRYISPVYLVQKRFVGEVVYLDRYKTVPYNRFTGEYGDIFDLTFDETFN